MAEEVKAAITPEGWAQALAWPHGVDDFIIRPAELLGYGKNEPHHLHYVAALALHAQPFGFTREDVAACREAAEWECVHNGECPVCGPDVDVGWKMPARPICTRCGFQPRRNTDDVLDALRNLASRISALLPPEAPTNG
jgi:hypothetical protein